MTPAELLEGKPLANGWEVAEKLIRKPNATGGFFSTGYRVRNSDGREGFLKALDYTRAFGHPDPRLTALLLNEMTAACLFEKKLCERCADRSLRRVVHAIDSGTIQVNEADPFSKVEYLIFKLADGDIRAVLDTQAQFDLAFALRTLHHVAAALRQLHSADIAHQDLKPSNVLVFRNENISRLGDLGRAWSKDLASPYDSIAIAGDRHYAPPEFLYREVPNDERQRRFGCDLYLLGSLIVFFFLRTHMNALLISHLAPEHRFDQWGGTYDEAMPYLLDAFAKALRDFSAQVPEVLQADLTILVQQLCDPDPLTRGHPLSRQWGGSQHSLDRYISTLDLLRYKAETNIFHRNSRNGRNI